MARGGGKRTYARDSRGRFASTPGGRAQAKSGTLGTRSSLKKSRAKLASKNPVDRSLKNTLSTKAQKGAVTRGSKALKASKAESRTRLSTGKTSGRIKTRNISPEANWKIIKQQPGRFPKVGDAVKVMAKRGAIKTGDVEALALIAKKTKTSKKQPPLRPPQSNANNRKAPRRLEFAIQYHGTNARAAAAIRTDGFKESTSGVYGGGVYSSSYKGTAKQYSPKKTGVVLRLRVPKAEFEKSKVHREEWGDNPPPMEMRARRRAIGTTRIEEHLSYRPNEKWLISTGESATKWLDRRPLIYSSRKTSSMRRKTAISGRKRKPG